MMMGIELIPLIGGIVVDFRKGVLADDGAETDGGRGVLWGADGGGGAGGGGRGVAALVGGGGAGAFGEEPAEGGEGGDYDGCVDAKRDVFVSHQSFRWEGKERRGRVWELTHRRWLRSGTTKPARPDRPGAPLSLWS